MSDNRERYAEAFREPAETRVVIFADIVGSTEYKQKHPQVDWLHTYGQVFDIIEDGLVQHGGEVVKFLGDGVLAVFTEDDAAKAINSAIDIQEALNETNRENLISCRCSIGIATGKVVRFTTSQDTADYIGTVVDRSKRLCEAAAGQAIWADSSTIANAQMGRVRSKLGIAQHRESGEYLTLLQTAVLKGFSQPIEYYEVVWFESPFGATNATLTEATGRLARATRAAAQGQRQPQPADDSRAKLSGTLDWREKHGFIRTENGQSYYTDSRYIVEMDGVQSGARAFFEPRPAKQEGRTPVGVAVVLKGQELTGWVAHVPSEKPYCFIEVFDPSDNKRELFHYFGDNPDQLREEEEVRLVVSENTKGPIAIEVRRVEGSSPQAA